MKQTGRQPHDFTTFILSAVFVEGDAESVAVIEEIDANLPRLVIDLDDARAEVAAVRSPTDCNLNHMLDFYNVVQITDKEELVTDRPSNGQTDELTLSKMRGRIKTR